MRHYEITPITEIERLRPDDYEGEEDLERKFPVKNLKKEQLKRVPGSSEFVYTVLGRGYGHLRIIIYGTTGNMHVPVAILTLRSVPYPETKNAYMVAYVSVDTNYRNKGLGKHLYNIALLPKPVGLGITLLSGEEQTPGGQQMWKMLNSMPNVEVLGYIKLVETSDSMFSDKEFVDDLFGKVGAYYIGSVGRSDKGLLIRYFQFPVNSNNENSALGSLIRVYGNRFFGIPGYTHDNYSYGTMKDRIGLVAKYLR